MSTAPPDPNGQQHTATERAGQFAGPENLARLESNLRRNESAMQHLLGCGLNAATINKFHLGLREPYKQKSGGKIISNVLCYPLIARDGQLLGRYGCRAIPGVTHNLNEAAGGLRGKPRSYYSDSPEGRTLLLVVSNCMELWVLDQHLRGTLSEKDICIITTSHELRVPDEWRGVEFWSGWTAVYFAQRTDIAGERLAQDLSRFCGRDILRVRVPTNMGQSWMEFFLRGGTPELLTDVMRNAPVLWSLPPVTEPAPGELGEFSVNPVNVNGAFVNGNLYYPFTVERRELEKVRRRGEKAATCLVTSYVTKVVRSDGAVLDVVRLAAPRGTPRERQVLALTDGTRIKKEPEPNHHATWQLDGIQAFIKAMQSRLPPPHRPLQELASGVISHLRRSVWLPYGDDYTVLALYTLLSYVYQVFEAIPLIMVRGEKGTGKSELGDAVARVSCNASVIGQGSAASVIRLLNEARGLVVLDDLESIGRALEDTAFGDINQMLKLGYKKRTGIKAITDKSGKTTIFDFYGPKVINNTRGADPILGSRMIYIQTRHVPQAVCSEAVLTGSEPDELLQLRDELHAWGMANARRVYEHYSRFVTSNTNRQNEIWAPLKAIAELCGNEEIRESLSAALERQSSRRRQISGPVELLKEAIRNCIRTGATERLSASHIMLELRLLAEEDPTYWERENAPGWLRPEWVGRQLQILKIRDPKAAVRRVRLYGLITRTYELRTEYVRGVVGESGATGKHSPTPRSSLAFCERTTCHECPYDKVCELTIHGLKKSKQLNRGRSGRTR